MIQVFTNPLLLDYVQVCILMPDDERKQIESLVGEPYDIDAVAVGNYMVPGPKWVIKTAANVPLVVGGFKQQRPGVWRDYLLTTPDAWDKRNAFTVTRTIKRIMDSMFVSKMAHRLECLAPRARVESRPELVKWYNFLGYTQESIRYGYCADGSDAVAFARVNHGYR